jgi:hypothetical protein
MSLELLIPPAGSPQDIAGRVAGAYGRLSRNSPAGGLSGGDAIAGILHHLRPGIYRSGSNVIGIGPVGAAGLGVCRIRPSTPFDHRRAVDLLRVGVTTKQVKKTQHTFDTQGMLCLIETPT